MDEKEMDEAVLDIAEGLGITDSVEDVEAPKDELESSGDSGIPAGDTTPPADTGEETSTTEVKEEEGVETPPSVEALAPPKTWRPDAVKEWDKLPPVVQSEILKREEDMFKGIEGYKQEAAIGKVVKEVVSPYLPELQAAGIDPIHQINALLKINSVLEKGTQEQRIEIFRNLMKGYNLDASHLSATPDIFVDPQIESLNKTVAELQSNLNAITNERVQTTRETLRQEIATFASDPANIHFDTVADDMTALIRAGLAKNLSDAYTQAVWRNPQTRALETARLAAETEAKVKRENEGKLVKLTAAASANVKTSAKAGSGTAPIGSMDDTLNETLLNIKSRA